MRRLILLRHGKAEPSSTGGDIERDLTERGRGDSALTAHALAAAGLAPDLALVSPARRTRETWASAAPAFPAARMRVDRALYLAPAERLAQAAAEAEADCLMIVGHNPGLHDLAVGLSASGETAAAIALAEGFPTAAAAVFDIGARGRAKLKRFITPRQLKAGAA